MSDRSIGRRLFPHRAGGADGSQGPDDTGIRVTGYGPRRSPLETGEELSPFTGRERDLAELRSRLETGLQGEGQLVGVAGEPGIGKTRLAFEFQQLVRGQADVLEGRCLSYGAGIPYLPLLDLLRGICGVQPEDDGAAVHAKVATAVASFELAEDTAEYLLHALGVSTNQSGLTSVDAPRSGPGRSTRYGTCCWARQTIAHCWC